MIFKNSALKVCVGLGAAVALASLLSVGAAKANTCTPANSVGFCISGGTQFELPVGVTDTTSFNPAGWVNSQHDGIGQGTYVTAFMSFGPNQGLFVGDGTSNVPLIVNLEFTYLGFEAGYTNLAQDVLNMNNHPLFANYTYGSLPAAGVGQTANDGYSLTPNPALVPFVFTSISGNTNAPNGGPITGDASIAFYLVSPTVAYAFFDDSGAGPDNDFDDMVVRIKIVSTSSNSAAPLPAGLPLFASGLGAMGLLGWRKRRKAALAA